VPFRQANLVEGAFIGGRQDNPDSHVCGFSFPGPRLIACELETLDGELTCTKELSIQVSPCTHCSCSAADIVLLCTTGSASDGNYLLALHWLVFNWIAGTLKFGLQVKVRWASQPHLLQIQLGARDSPAFCWWWIFNGC